MVERKYKKEDILYIRWALTSIIRIIEIEAIII
jgi:hypothetical protein